VTEKRFALISHYARCLFHRKYCACLVADCAKIKPLGVHVFFSRVIERAGCKQFYRADLRNDLICIAALRRTRLQSRDEKVRCRVAEIIIAKMLPKMIASASSRSNRSDIPFSYAHRLSGGRQVSRERHMLEWRNNTARCAQLRPSIHRRATGFEEVNGTRAAKLWKTISNRDGFKQVLTP
jgi:hypothetical protein